MTGASDAIDTPQDGEPAPVVRIFSWSTLAVLAAYLINNFLTVSFGFPGAAGILGGASVPSLLQAALYVVLLVIAVVWVLRTPRQALRWDARRISDFNAWFIRGCFFAVLFVGVVDAAIAFMRIEGFLRIFFDADMVSSFDRVRFIGPNIHVPLIALGFVVALFTRTLGFTWLALLIVVAELLIVISRFVFSYEQAFMGDLVRYWYAALFLFASAYTLLADGHVRVDVLYAGFGPRGKGRVNAVGSILLGMTTAWVVIAIGLGGGASIINSPVANYEITQTGGTGMFVKYQMAAFLGVFAVSMLIQFVSYLMEAVADIRHEPGRREPTPIAH